MMHIAGMNAYWLRSRTGVSVLPTELLLKVHKLLPLRDLKSAVLVNKEWNKVGEDPSLWNKSVVKVDRKREIAKICVRRLARVQKVWVGKGGHSWRKTDWKMFFESVLNLTELKQIGGLEKMDLKDVDPGLLARALTRVEYVAVLNGVMLLQIFRPTVTGVQLTSEQITSFFAHLAMQDTKLKQMMFYGYDLSFVDTDDLAIAVNKVEKVVFCSASLSTQQVTSILRHIVDKDTKLKLLYLGFNVLSGVEDGLLNSAKNKLSQSGGRIY